MANFDRTTIEGFAQRVRTNSDYLSRAFEQGEEVHVVTQFVISLLGLIVFPYAALRAAKKFPKNRRIEELHASGWPTFVQLHGAKLETLEELVRHLRDAISHYHINFEPPNERQLAKVDITFGRLQSNRKNDRVTKINAIELREFVDRFSALIENVVN
jgi:HEPN pEK499 p136